MSASLRLTLAAVLVAALGGFALLLSEPPGPSGGERARFTSSAECRACHAEVFDEWQGSHHQIAYLNPEVRRLSDDFRNKECQACHLPRPVFETGLLQRTLPRLTRPDEGVDCLTCHLGPGGEVLGSASSEEGCRPVASAELLSVALCETCHNQHGTTDQWRASRYAAEGVTCNDCHMPEVARADGSAGRGHVYRGCHDLEVLRSAATFEARREGDELVLVTSNTGAGHNFPTEERHRAVDVMVRFPGAPDGGAEWRRVFRFRQPYRDEPGENTQLPADAVHVDRVAIPAGARRAEARLWYRLNPFAEDDDPASTLLFHEEVELE